MTQNNFVNVHASGDASGGLQARNVDEVKQRQRPGSSFRAPAVKDRLVGEQAPSEMQSIVDRVVGKRHVMRRAARAGRAK